MSGTAVPRRPGPERCPVPVGVAVLPRDITRSVRPIVQRLDDVRHRTGFGRGPVA
ncbi:hypothetical protein [Actinomadura gamaensis]|uniref:Uncharacterized protein n=1 Tax=Actinomadura gamaensis TaxID=1763541 RepID=A0ABV9TU47_9ACTN